MIINNKQLRTGCASIAPNLNAITSKINANAPYICLKLSIDKLRRIGSFPYLI